MHGNTAGHESAEWYEAYAADSGRRRAQMLEKLRSVGLDRVSRDAAVLDLCCGHCESLDVLYEHGFRRLCGMDIHLDRDVLADPRFALVEGDVESPPFARDSQDWILVIHALHHLDGPEKIGRVLDRAYELLRPGGRIGLIDFTYNPVVLLALRLFLVKPLLVTPYLRYFGSLVQEEWPQLSLYLPRIPRVLARLKNGQFDVETERHGLFYFSMTLRKR
ncbi:MAG TPA: methyltransferase domain-containing protein [Xanthomonadales bacterium]|nr:methyltransferase domain-containing protein [Xanthomonadales bacterium]